MASITIQVDEDINKVFEEANSEIHKQLSSIVQLFLRINVGGSSVSSFRMWVSLRN